MHNLILEKSCNAFSTDAAPLNLGWGIRLAGSAAADRYKRNHGGLWVGGKFTATTEWLVFAPNGLNAAFHNNVGQVQVHVSEVHSIHLESAWITDIVVIRHARGELKVRCYGARQVVDSLRYYYRLG